MRLFSLIGTLAVLIVPFSYISYQAGNLASAATFMGFLWFSSESEIIGFERSGSETFQFSWLQENGLYHSYFDPLFIIGVLVFVGLIVNIIISLTASKDNNQKLPAILLIVLGIILVIVRLSVLGEDDLSFYTQRNVFIIGEITYIEVPIGFLLSLLFGIIDLRDN